MAERVLLAMSGGVDSSVAAVLLKRRGYEVVGLFMRTGVKEPEPADCDVPDVKSHKKGCCSAVDAGDARRVADRLDIPFHALDFETDFNRIIDYFTDEYLAGRTPNPCVVCNNWLKFGKLWEFGRRLDADYIATGHYAQIIDGPGGPELHRGRDADKDQTYVLHGINRELLPRLLFPIGGYRKDDIRQMAAEFGLGGVAAKPDSVEICFVPDNDHVRLVRERKGELQTAGRFVDASGEVVGEHDGIEQFTVGQRKGLGVSAGRRRYVLDIVPADNTVVLGDKDDLLAGGLAASSMNWLTDITEGESLDCGAQIRYKHRPAPASVRPLPDGRAEVTFSEPQPAVTPGQAVALYDGERLLGGGWIDRRL